MPVIEILNPQDPIPEVMSMYTVLGGLEMKLDLNEDSWATDYFIIFFHTGPNDPVSTAILRYCSSFMMLSLVLILVPMLFQMMILMLMFRTVDSSNETLPCKATFPSNNHHLPPLPESVSDFCSTQVVGVSMDTTNSIFDWLDSNPDLKEFNVPLMSDRWK